MLEQNHRKDFHSSGLTDNSIEKYDISSVNRGEASRVLGFTVPSGGWLIRYPNSHFLKFKPDKPFGDNKYLSPKDMSPDLFMTHLSLSVLDDIGTPYYFVEGEKKGVALEQAGYTTISITGVWGWLSSGHTCERLAKINLTGRICYIIFDSDKYDNEHVLRAEKRLAQALLSLGTIVKIVNLDPSFGKGADDQLLHLGKNDFQYYVDKAVDYVEGSKDDPLQLPPIPLSEFVKKDIPPVKYYVDGILQVQGKMMVSAPANIGKSIFIMNLALAIASGETKFLGRFNINHDNS